MSKDPILLKKVSVHNLKGVDLELQAGELIAFTGVSGSGKSSLAFDTIYVEGQRRYIESLSTFARRYLGDMRKPDVEEVSGLSPTISIEQKTAGKNPRSTVGTMTEIYDYLRVLYARVGTPHCPVSLEPVLPQSKERIIKKIQHLPEGTKIILLAPFAKGKKGEFKDDFDHLLRKGYMRARVDGKVIDLSEEISLDKNLAHDVDVVIDRLTVSKENQSRIAEAVLAALECGNGVLTVHNLTQEEETLYSTHAYSPKSGLSYSSLEPQDFSFNSPGGMCPTCHGLGYTQNFDLALIIDPEKSIAEDCCVIASSYQTVRYGNIYTNLATLFHFSVHTPWKELSEKAKKVFLYGTEKKWTSMHFVHPSRPVSWTEYVQWKGVIQEAYEKYQEAKSDLYKAHKEKLMTFGKCPSCNGSKLKPYPSATLLNGKKIQEVTSSTIQEAFDFFIGLPLDPTEKLIAEDLVHEITERLQFLLNVGLHYLTLDRTAPTLSGGESQRVRLASQIGSGLVGVIYVLDEPSIGLHPRDNKQLISTLEYLRDLGNTVIVVEHDEETIWSADRVVDVGPGAGKNGGEILVNGSHKELIENSRSLTGAYLSGKLKIPIPEERRSIPEEALEIFGASHHNLKNIHVSFPLGVLVAVTGVSGSGKSSLISDTLYPLLSNTLHRGEQRIGAYEKVEGISFIDKVIAIDQSPIGRNPRSNPATYTKLFDEIRQLFSALPESLARGYGPGRFSFNAKAGRCPECQGMGMTRIDMDFMEAAWVPCATCDNKRFDSETLSVLYRGKNIHDVLDMSIDEALEFFQNIPQIKRKLEVISQVGLGYISLGQPSTTLSGGEAQRIKLAKELARPGSGKTLYILDEPTTGLHFHDINTLLKVLHRLVDRGNSVIVIEHNMDVVKTADWIIDLGPEGGAFGGEIVATGTPEKIIKQNTPTGKALKEVFQKTPLALHLKEKKKVTHSKVTEISIEGASQNNLKNLSLTIPRDQITICTGPSGSGKSSLAFETVYAEGQRRYIESLSPYARQFVKQMPKPKVLQIDGLSPAIAIEQKASAGNPRSTVGTMTEIYDYLRILFAQAGTAYCPDTGEVIKSITKSYVAEKILSYPAEERIHILAPLYLEKQTSFEELIQKLRAQGYLRIRLNGSFYELDDSIPFERRRKNELALVIDRLKVSPQNSSRIQEALENGLKVSKDKILVLREDGSEDFFNLSFAVEKTGKSYALITPHTFSFNSPHGMCMDCQGLGYQYGADFTSHDFIMSKSLVGLLEILWTNPSLKLLEPFLKEERIDPYEALKDLSPSQLQLILNGSEKWISWKGFQYRWVGIQNILAKAGKSAHAAVKTPLIPLLNEIECISCGGTRLNPLARHVRIHEHSLPSLCHIPIWRTSAFLERMELLPQMRTLLEEVLKQLKARLGFLAEVGLDYLGLDRRAPTLSNGEAQRIRLARQLGSSLTGVLYVLDEPTVGLHPRDTDQLQRALKKLNRLGNTLLMVEHDPYTLANADRIIDFGPGAGIHGGHIMAQGSYQEILLAENSLTGAYLSGKKKIPIPEKRRKAKSFLQIENVRVNNLKGFNLSLPLKVLTCLTGVSGSGKSTLLFDVIRPLAEEKIRERTLFNKMILIDQNPIGHTVRSDVGTFVDLFPLLRTFYASLGKARIKDLQPKHFSYNHRQGMCSHCLGMGYKKVEMHFLPSVKVTCDHCQGFRLNPVSLEVEYHGFHFGKLLEMTIKEARVFFDLIPKACKILDTLLSVGLGYLKLGQEMPSLSGGEAQRMKLSRELAKRSTGKTLYLLDEPTTGLHPDDMEKLLKVLHQLVDQGNTMIMIEHNLEMMKNADHLIDLGPEAGENGGYLICEGTPEAVSKHPTSHTGFYLRTYES